VKIPDTIPVLDSADARYPAGADAWSATPVSVPLTSSELLAGVTPGKQLTGQNFNALGRDWGRAIAANYDIAALNFPGPQQALDLAYQTSVVRTATKVIGAKAIVSGESIPRDYLCFTDTFSRRFSYAERDEDTQWIDGDAWGGSGSICNVESGYLGGVPYLVAGFPVSSSFKKLADIFSGLWISAGSAPLAGSSLQATRTIYSAKTQDRWFTGATGAVARSDNLSTWTVVSVGGSAIPTYAAAGTDGVAYATNATETWYSQDTLTWARRTGTPTLTGIAFSEARQTWYGTAGSHLYSAPVGLASWTDLGDPGMGTLTAIAVFGRCLALASGIGVFIQSVSAGAFVPVLRPRGSPGFSDLTICGGRLVAIEYAPAGSGTHYVHRSLRAPFAVF
jgi:hypothetical protein